MNLYEGVAKYYDIEESEYQQEDMDFYIEYAQKCKDNNFHQTQKAYMELRYYEYKEIVTLLESVGFKIKEKYGWYDKCSLEKGHEIIIVAEK